MSKTRRMTRFANRAADRMRRIGVVLIAGVAVTALAACGDDGNGMTDPGGDDQVQTATIDGSVENTTTTASPYTDATYATAPASSAGAAQEAATAAVASVNADGSLNVLASADVQSDGSFTIEEVPAGNSGLVVTVRTGDDAEVGRVLVHGETEGGATITTEPVTAETTVEGMVYSHLTAAGVSEQVRNTARLALLIRMDESTAADVAASAQAIADVASGVQAGAEAMASTYAETGADASAQNDALVTEARAHAQARQGGTAADAAHDAFAQAAVSAFASGGADTEDVSLGTAAAATGLDQAMAQASAEAQSHLELARSTVDLNLVAREELNAGLQSTGETDATATALADARASVAASADVAALAQALVDMEAGLESELMTLIMARIPDIVDVTVRSEFQSRLETAFAEADLSAHVEASGAADPDAVAQAIIDYRSELQTAVQAVIDAAPSEVGVEAEATTSLLIAAQGGPSIGS